MEHWRKRKPPQMQTGMSDVLSLNLNGKLYVKKQFQESFHGFKYMWKKFTHFTIKDSYKSDYFTYSIFNY